MEVSISLDENVFKNWYYWAKGKEKSKSKLMGKSLLEKYLLISN